MERTPIPCRIAPSVPMSCGFGTPPGINPPFGGLAPGKGQVGYALLTRAPVAGSHRRSGNPAAPRLACVRPVASVHPEPGSNSSLYWPRVQNRRHLRRLPHSFPSLYPNPFNDLSFLVALGSFPKADAKVRTFSESARVYILFFEIFPIKFINTLNYNKI